MRHDGRSRNVRWKMKTTGAAYCHPVRLALVANGRPALTNPEHLSAPSAQTTYNAANEKHAYMCAFELNCRQQT